MEIEAERTNKFIPLVNFKIKSVSYNISGRYAFIYYKFA